jgi:hypothetical protein
MRRATVTNASFNRDLLWCIVGMWLCYLLSWVTLPPDAVLLREILRGYLGAALMFGTLTAGIAVYGALRYRYLGYLLSALMAAPLSALCWYHVLHWPSP